MTDAALGAALKIWQAWTEGKPIRELPEPIRPATIDDGYAAQAQLDQFAGSRRGWKLAATGAGGRAALGVEHPLVGPLYARFEVPSGGEVNLARSRMRTIEAEFGFVIGTDLELQKAPFDRSTVEAAIKAFVPALEMPDTRYVDHRAVGGPHLVADASCAGPYVLGKAKTAFNLQSLPQAEVSLSVGDGSVSTGRGENVMGDPIEAVVWLANELARQGRSLSSGDIVITGSAIAVKDPPPGWVTAHFGPLGSVAVDLR